MWIFIHLMSPCVSYILHSTHDIHTFRITPCSYAIIENLRYMLSVYDPEDPIFFGSRIKSQAKQGSVSRSESTMFNVPLLVCQAVGPVGANSWMMQRYSKRYFVDRDLSDTPKITWNIKYRNIDKDTHAHACTHAYI